MRDLALALLHGVRRRLSPVLRHSTSLCELNDWLMARQRLAGDKATLLDARRWRCRTPDEYFSFAAEVFPSYQCRSEITGFLQYATSERPRVVCEIGTAEGGTNFLLSQAIPSVQAMLGIDLFVWNKRLLRRFGRPGTELLFVNGSSCAMRTVEKARRLLAGRPLDLLFIDGNHTYQGVKQDFATYRRFVRDGGLVAFHDIVPDYYTRYGRKTGRWAGEVHRFWSELRESFEHREFIEDPEQDGLGIGVIRYKTNVDLPSGV